MNPAQLQDVWLLVPAAIILLLIGFGIGYVARNARTFRPFLDKPRNITPVNLDRSPDDPHGPGATS